MINDIRSGKYSVLSEAEPKRYLSKLRAQLQMDNNMVDLNNSQSVLRAEAYSRAQEAILAGERPDIASSEALVWFMQNAEVDVDTTGMASQIQATKSFDELRVIYNRFNQLIDTGVLPLSEVQRLTTLYKQQVLILKGLPAE